MNQRPAPDPREAEYGAWKFLVIDRNCTWRKVLSTLVLQSLADLGDRCKSGMVTDPTPHLLIKLWDPKDRSGLRGNLPLREQTVGRERVVLFEIRGVLLPHPSKPRSDRLNGLTKVPSTENDRNFLIRELEHAVREKGDLGDLAIPCKPLTECRRLILWAIEQARGDNNSEDGTSRQIWEGTLQHPQWIRVLERRIHEQDPATFRLFLELSCP